jgi:intein/homing endonuclease
MSADPADGRRSARRVLQLRRREVSEILAVELSDGTALLVTAEHPFFDPRLGDYRPIGEFRPGDAALKLEPSRREVEIVRIELRRKRIAVYNLTVDGEFQNFLAEGMLVHNK